jgi:hypothetical protein
MPIVAQIVVLDAVFSLDPDRCARRKKSAQGTRPIRALMTEGPG